MEKLKSKPENNQFCLSIILLNIHPSNRYLYSGFPKRTTTDFTSGVYNKNV